MAKASKIKTKISSYGRNLTLSMTADRFAAMAKHLPEDNEERLAIEKMVAESKEVKARDELKGKLNQPLSRETLARFGWDLLESKGIISAGVRHGDFRLDSSRDGEGWVFGPHGAFDREDEGRLVIKNAWQAGVFCEKHSAFMLEEPSQDEEEARTSSAELLAGWHKEVPKVLRPAASRNDETHPSLPKGARRLIWGVMRTGDMLFQLVRHGYDEPTHRDNSGRRVDLLSFDAILQIDRYDILKDPSWGPGSRKYDPRFDTHKYIFDSPIDCVMGNVWGAVANTNSQSRHGCREIYPYTDKEAAQKAAEAIAVETGFIEGESIDHPQPLQIPDFARGGAGAENPFA